MYIKKFKNDNINIKYEKDYDYSYNLIELLCNSIKLDFVYMNEGCYGNFDYYFDLYNVNNQKMYTILGEDIKNFVNCHTIKLVGHEFCKDDYETCENFNYIV